jgi:chromate transporter
MVLLLSAAYVRYGGLRWMQSIFYGIGAAVIAIITRSAYKLTKLTLGKDKVLWGIFVVLAVPTAWTSREIVWLFLVAGVIALLVKAMPTRAQAEAIRPAVWLFGPPTVTGSSGLLEIFLYFAKAGVFVLGSGLAVVPFLYGGVLQEHHWLTDRQFVDAVAVAMITPGPVVITVAFIGYLVAGIYGVTVAAILKGCAAAGLLLRAA